MKKMNVLTMCVLLAFSLSLHAALKSTDEMSKMSLTQLQTYFTSLPGPDMVQAMVNIIATNNSRFLRVAITAAQNTINSRPVAERQALLDSLLAACPSLTGTVGAGSRVILTVATNILNTDKIGSDTPTVSKVANEQ